MRSLAPYAALPLSISLFSVTFGLSEPPSQLGMSSYATMLLPEWMQTLSDCRRGAAIMADDPGEAMLQRLHGRHTGQRHGRAAGARLSAG